jgi:hypothetical protein
VEEIATERGRTHTSTNTKADLPVARHPLLGRGHRGSRPR